jgi:hypothetical protein
MPYVLLILWTLCSQDFANDVIISGDTPRIIKNTYTNGLAIGGPLKHPLSYPNCTPSTLTTRLPALKTCNNHIFGMPAALTAPLSTLNYWFRGLKLLAFQLNFSVL